MIIIRSRDRRAARAIKFNAPTYHDIIRRGTPRAQRGSPACILRDRDRSIVDIVGSAETIDRARESDDDY